MGILRMFFEFCCFVGCDVMFVEIEEGLFRYYFVIEIDFKSVIMYERDVVGIKKIIMLLVIVESISFVFVYGVDIFGIRVIFSFLFDIFGKGFNKVLFVLMVLVLFVGVIMLGFMVSLFFLYIMGIVVNNLFLQVRKKQINLRWSVLMQMG